MDFVSYAVGGRGALSRPQRDVPPTRGRADSEANDSLPAGLRGGRGSRRPRCCFRFYHQPSGGGLLVSAAGSAALPIERRERSGPFGPAGKRMATSDGGGRMKYKTK